jgi:hypothetical protein
MRIGRRRPRTPPRNEAQSGSSPGKNPGKGAPAKLRRRRPPSIGGPHYFGLRTRLAKSVGIDKRYKLNAIRVLPSSKKDTVVLQATDGKQAVCLLTLGKMSSPRLVPSAVLPTRKDAKGTMVDLAGDQWRSSDGKSVPDDYNGESLYPQLSDVLPKISTQARSYQVRLGIDLSLLTRVAESLGTSKLTLFVSVPRKPTDDHRGELFVSKAVAVCPATDESDVRGIGVVMPLQPSNGVQYYMKVRKAVADAEERSNGNLRKLVDSSA